MWSFGKVNGKLAEVYFENKRGKSHPYAHCFVQKEKYKTKSEQKWIEEDLKRVNLKFENYKYTDI
jgi:hypothetical protein